MASKTTKTFHHKIASKQQTEVPKIVSSSSSSNHNSDS